MNLLHISKQTEAERDKNLFECFHNTGIIDELVQSSYSILSGRIGSGKTAIAMYIEKKPQEFNIDYAYRISIRNFNILRHTEEKDTLDSILFYIITKTVQKLLETDCFKGSIEKYWKDFITTNGLQNISDYESFVTTKKTKKSGFSLKAITSCFVAKGEGETTVENKYLQEKTTLPSTPSALFESLRKSIPDKRKIFIFIDDISDYLDKSQEQTLKEDINVIKDLLLQMQAYNLSFIESDLNIRFISLIRDDLFEFMKGSNINKIKSDSLKLEWFEKDFACLLIKRMSYFENNIEEALVDPVKSLKERFPDNIFFKTLEAFNTNRYGSNFYAYMAAISFNRPRDYLQFCYTLRNRLSDKNPATFENIESAEIEYCDYFIQELRDELYIVGEICNYDFSYKRINQLIDVMSKKNGFSSSELKVELGKFIDKKTKIGKKKIEMLVSELWRYGVIGVKEKTDKIIRFKYLSDAAIFSSEKIKKYIFFLHRGLWWFAKKYKHDK